MRTVLSMLIASTMSAPMLSLAQGGHIGIFSLTEEESCVYFAHAHPQKDDWLSLLSRETEAPVIQAQVTGPAQNCETLKRVLGSEGAYFDLNHNATITTPDLGFAIKGSGTSSSAAHGMRAWHDKETGTTLFLNACQSTEGVHFSVWAQPQLNGEPIWHQYYYLGYDVTPDCEKGAAR